MLLYYSFDPTQPFGVLPQFASSDFRHSIRSQVNGSPLSIIHTDVTGKAAYVRKVVDTPALPQVCGEFLLPGDPKSSGPQGRFGN